MLQQDSPYLVEGAVMMHLNSVNMDCNTLHCISDQLYSIHFVIMVDLLMKLLLLSVLFNKDGQNNTLT